jgi:hypothetical protein
VRRKKGVKKGESHVRTGVEQNKKIQPKLEQNHSSNTAKRRQIKISTRTHHFFTYVYITKCLASRTLIHSPIRPPFCMTPFGPHDCNKNNEATFLLCNKETKNKED